MLGNAHYYHQLTRKAVVLFGRLFDDISIIRKNDQTSKEVSRFLVPIIYSPKEKMVTRIFSDPDLTRQLQAILPRMSFEIIGYNYDPLRKVGRTQQIICGEGDNQMKTVYSPVPYNIDLSLYILTKTQEDGLQIIEQILPTFTPEYTLSVNVVPDMNVKIDVPIILNGVSVQDEYDGDFQTRRFVTHTLNFQMKTNLFGNISGHSVIETVNANVGIKEDLTPARIYTAQGDVTTATVNNENWEDNF